MNIVGVILAAGASSRMGAANKLLLEYKGRTIIEQSLWNLSKSMCHRIIVVTGFERSRIEERLAEHLTDRIELLHNDQYTLGRAESIKCAVRHVADQADAVLFVVADKPDIRPALIDKAIDCFRGTKPAILYVETPTGRGHPIIFAKDVFADLRQLQGDLVGNSLVKKYKDNLIKLKDQTQQIDIDDDADYRRALEQAASQKEGGSLNRP